MKKEHKKALLYVLSLVALAILVGLLYQVLFVTRPKLSQPPYGFSFKRMGNNIQFEATTTNYEDVERTYTYAVTLRWYRGDVEQHRPPIHHTVNVKPGKTVYTTLYNSAPADVDIWVGVKIYREGEVLGEQSFFIQATPSPNP